MTTSQTDRFAQLPKAELHIHLEGALRRSTAVEFGERYGRPLPEEGPFASLEAFVPVYEKARDLIGSLDDLRRVAGELVEDAVRQGVVWSEVHVIPPTYGGRLGPEEGVIEAVLDGFSSARSERSDAQLIIGINRGLTAQDAERSLELALRYAGRGVIGLGLAGDEANNPPERFADLFARARAAGLHALPHGGEGAGPESVRSCVMDLGATRICHGVRAAEDPDVLDLLAATNTCLDVCPSSNVSLQIIPTLADHPVPRMLEAGVPITLNSDGTLFSGATINDEYANAARIFGWDDRTLAGIARTSLEVSSCSEPRRRDALARIEKWVTEPTAVASPR